MMISRISKDRPFKVHAINLACNAVVPYQAACAFGVHVFAAVAVVQSIKFKLLRLEFINLSADT
jgi:hypothetical protein